MAITPPLGTESHVDDFQRHCVRVQSHLLSSQNRLLLLSQRIIRVLVAEQEAEDIRTRKRKKGKGTIASVRRMRARRGKSSRPPQNARRRLTSATLKPRHHALERNAQQGGKEREHIVFFVESVDFMKSRFCPKAFFLLFFLGHRSDSSFGCHEAGCCCSQVDHR